ncbi:MAG: SDR family oxidoreductase [Alphaproteobacteria bacterium]|nr:SDR family oxidoreductase [Alphaproteobacteria bacterium]
MAEASGIVPGSTALVTGAGAGIGLAIAERLAERKVRVICAGRRLDRLEALAKRLGNGATALKLDVSKGEECAGLLDRLPASHRQIDILINNAGHDVGGRKRFDEGKLDDFVETLETNVVGLVRVTHAVVPQMVKRGTGDIVNLGSVAGWKPYPTGNIYAATKAFVRVFTDGLRLDYKDTDIRIMEMLPGITRTEFAAARFRGDTAHGDAYYKKFPHVMAADDIARGVIYALDQPRSVTIAQMLVLPTRDI